jgi:hypothetical protein
MMGVSAWTLWHLFDTTPTPVDTVQRLVESASENGITLSSTSVDSTLSRTWITYIAYKALWVMFLFWPIRILVRNYLSNQHLAMDASERKVVLETYLAMNTHEEFAADPARQKGLIQALKVVFRHTQDGIVKDDAFPQPGFFGWPKQ